LNCDSRILKSAIVAALFSIISCAPQIKPAVQPEYEAGAKPAVNRSDTRASEDNELLSLLAQAKTAFSNDRLMRPKEDNAYRWYSQMLKIDENNLEAHNGMHTITARYFELAEHAYDAGRYNRAMLMLDRAAKVSANPQRIDELRVRYRPPVSAKNEFRLPVGHLNARNEELLHYLDQLTTQLVEAQSRLLIIARSDAEGRWIYQRMRSYAGGHRLRGDIKIGSIPAVIMIDLDAS